MEQVKYAVETLRCSPLGAYRIQSLPLNTAAHSGTVAIFEFLTEKGATPDAFTLRNAIDSGRLELVRHVLDAAGVELTSADFEGAFKARNEELLKFFFMRAFEDGWFETNRIARYGGEQDKVCQAVRLMLTEHPYVLMDVLATLRRPDVVGMLSCYPDGEPRLQLLTKLVGNSDTLKFKALWPLIHEDLFKGDRYLRFESYVIKHEVDELMLLAIELGADDIFYYLLEYALPNLPRCVNTARAYGNIEVAEYLERCMSVA